MRGRIILTRYSTLRGISSEALLSDLRLGRFSRFEPMSPANFGCERFVFHQSSNFLKYDLYRVATGTEFCRAAKRVVDLAHPQTRRAARNHGPYLGVAEKIARADDYGAGLAPRLETSTSQPAGEW